MVRKIIQKNDMKIILLKDIAKIGRRFDVVEVPDGFAMNQLVPKRMAEAATPANLKRVEKRAAGIVANQEGSKQRFDTALATLKTTTVKIVADANEKDHLFKAVHERDIVEAAVATGVDIDASMLTIDTPIKALGLHEVWLTQGAEKASFSVEVIKK